MVAIRQGDRKTAIGRWERAVALQPANSTRLRPQRPARAGRPDRRREEIYGTVVRTAPRGQYGKDIDKLSTLLAHLR